MSRSRTDVSLSCNGSGLCGLRYVKLIKYSTKIEVAKKKKRRDDDRRSKRRFARIGNSRRWRDDDDDGDGKLRERGTVIQIRPPRRITITTRGSIIQQDLQRILQGISPTSYLILSPVYKWAMIESRDNGYIQQRKLQLCKYCKILQYNWFTYLDYSSIRNQRQEL